MLKMLSLFAMAVAGILTKTEKAEVTMCEEMQKLCDSSNSTNNFESCGLRYSACVGSNIWISMCKGAPLQSSHQNKDEHIDIKRND